MIDATFEFRAVDCNNKERKDGFNAALSGKSRDSNPYSWSANRGRGRGRLSAVRMRVILAREIRWFEGYDSAKGIT